MKSSYKPTILEWVSCYALFLALLPLCYVAFRFWGQTALLLLGITIGDSESTPALLAIWIILLGFGFFGLVIVAEPYLRAGVWRHKLIPRFARVAVALAAAIGLAFLIQEIIRRVG
jgi:hypothetical protein